MPVFRTGKTQLAFILNDIIGDRETEMKAFPHPYLLGILKWLQKIQWYFACQQCAFKYVLEQLH